VVFALITGCQHSNRTATPASTAENCRVVQHTAGETCIPPNPQRIVALDILSLSNIVALGIKPIAAEIWSPVEGEVGFPTYLANKIKAIFLYSHSAAQPNLEKVLQLKPDLIILPSDPSSQGIYKQLSQIAPTVLVPWAEISRDWKQHLIETAKVFDKTEVATQLLDGYYQRVEELKRSLDVLPNSLQQQQPFYASFAYVGNGGLTLAVKNSFSGTILNDLGLLSPKSSDGLALPISEESLPEIESDVLFVGAYQESDRSTLERLQRKPLWSTIKAVQQNQVYTVDFQTWYGFDFLSAHAVLDDIEKYLVNTP
jgi:iron complex transport system substrate-binding protein